MSNLSDKRARLRTELQEAYGQWLRVSSPMEAAGYRPVDIHGSNSAAIVQWRSYLTAKKRLIEAYAEVPVAA